MNIRGEVGVEHEGGARWAAILESVDWEEIASRLEITRREMQVVECVCAGHADASIASALRISQNTVHAHINRLYVKLRVCNRTQLVLVVFVEFVKLSQRSRGS